MVEGAILYSSFAFLKHFQSKEKTALNIVQNKTFPWEENMHSGRGFLISIAHKKERRTIVVQKKK